MKSKPISFNYNNYVDIKNKYEALSAQLSEQQKLTPEELELSMKLLKAWTEGTLVQIPFRSKGIVHIVKDLYDIEIGGNKEKAKGVLFAITVEENAEFEKAMAQACVNDTDVAAED